MLSGDWSSDVCSSDLYINSTFYCQYAENTLTFFAVNVTARQAFTNWQAGQTLTGFATWQAGCKMLSASLRAVSGWLFTTWQAVCRSGPARNFCTGSLGTHPKPRNRTSASCAFSRFFTFTILLTSEYSQRQYPAKILKFCFPSLENRMKFFMMSSSRSFWNIPS